MQETGRTLGFSRLHSWVAVQHMLHAAIILATDVSLEPDGPHTAARRCEVLAACEMLQSWQQESAAVVTPEGIQKCVRLLKSLIHKQSGQETMQSDNIGSHRSSSWSSTYVPTSEVLSIDRGPSAPSPVGPFPCAVSHEELRLSTTGAATASHRLPRMRTKYQIW